MRSKKVEKLWIVLCFALVGIIVGGVRVQAANVVTKRINEVKKQYPTGSRFRSMIFVYEATGKKEIATTCGGCDGLVAYTTLKVFHSPFIKGSKQYKRVKKAVSLNDSSKLKKLFKSAKRGDVIYLYNSKGECHVMIFLSANRRGIKVYEANYGKRDEVWYNHFWKYGSIKYGGYGATKLAVYHSKKYTKVNQNKVAKKQKVGSTFTVNEITYKVTNNSIANGKVKVVKKNAANAKTPKYIGVNIQRTTEGNLYFPQYAVYSKITYRMYKGIKYSNACDEEFFKVVN